MYFRTHISYILKSCPEGPSIYHFAEALATPSAPGLMLSDCLVVINGNGGHFLEECKNMYSVIQTSITDTCGGPRLLVLSQRQEQCMSCRIWQILMGGNM